MTIEEHEWLVNELANGNNGISPSEARNFLAILKRLGYAPMKLSDIAEYDRMLGAGRS
jgi:hypothetical protein